MRSHQHDIHAHEDKFLSQEQFAGLETRISAMEKDTTDPRCDYGENAKSKSRNVPIECKAVLDGFKAESKKEDVKSITAESIKATGMKKEHTIDCPAIPITHAFVEFQNMKIRDRYVRSANMRRYELDGRRIKISPALEADERFDRKRLGYIKYAINKEKGIALHWIQMSYQKRSIMIDGQIIAMIDASGMLRYNKYEDVDEEVQRNMKKWLTTNS